MNTYTIFRALTSIYENESENTTVVMELSANAESDGDLFERLAEEDFNDEDCINPQAVTDLLETNKEDFLVIDSSGMEIFRDDDVINDLRKRALLPSGLLNLK